jgi:hypothetical protein
MIDRYLPRAWPRDRCVIAARLGAAPVNLHLAVPA